jgi:hypothetical protein
MLHPKEQSIPLGDGTEKVFVLHKFPAVEGREIVTQYPLSALPKLGDYAVNEAIMLKLLSYVGVPNAENPTAPPLMLSTRALVNNHVPDFEALMRLEAAMLEYNCSFFGNGKVLTFFEAIAAKCQALISRTLTDSLQQFSKKS